MTYETLLVDVDGDGICTLTLHRPEALNAFNLTMARELRDFFEGRATEDDIKAVVVTGHGRAFCAGMDLGAEGNVFGLDESLNPTPESLRENFTDPAWDEGVRDTGGQVTLAIAALPKPVIAAINGAAVGIGATMTTAMDIRMASTTAKIGFIFAKVGVAPEGTSSYFLPRIVGLQQALEWVFSAEVLTADKALAGRLVRSVHEPDELVPAALELARSFVVGNSLQTLAYAKQLMVHGAHGTIMDAHLAESLAMYYGSINDGKEGVQAFNEKRKPDFTGSASKTERIFPA
jgi:enoyl-CoA hydratase/carnithine racemase